MNEKIFINIASFRDPSLEITIKSALLHAKNPENLVFGIALQYYENEMPHLDFVKNQIKTIYYHPDTRPGLVRVRYEISKMVTDEKYFLMIDSHTLFYPEWDVNVKNYLSIAEEKSGHNNVIIAGNGSNPSSDIVSPNFYYPDVDLRGFLYLRDLKRFIVKDKGLTRIHHLDFSNFFTHSSFLNEVGFDEHSMFLHEEPYMSWKSFVSGWDIYIPENPFCNQNPQSYFNIVWNNLPTSRDYFRKENRDPVELEQEMFLAMTLDRQNRYSAKQNKRSSKEFWEFVGVGKEFEDCLNHESFEKIASKF